MNGMAANQAGKRKTPFRRRADPANHSVAFLNSPQ
jgi:hypothetical protein